MTTIAERIRESQSASYWLKDALAGALERDVVDALGDAEALVAALKELLPE